MSFVLLGSGTLLTNVQNVPNVKNSQTTMKRKGWGLKMEDCKRGIQSLIDKAKMGINKRL